VKTPAGLRRDRGLVRHDEPRDVPQDEGFVRHPIRGTVKEAGHVREVVDQGESPATPAIIAGVVLAVVVPLAALLIFMDFAIEHFV
jgi:hypothetical protein